MPSINLSNSRSSWLSAGRVIAILATGLLLGDYFPWFEAGSDTAGNQLNELLSNYIGILGLGFAILANMMNRISSLRLYSSSITLRTRTLGMGGVFMRKSWMMIGENVNSTFLGTPQNTP